MYGYSYLWMPNNCEQCGGSFSGAMWKPKPICRAIVRRHCSQECFDRWIGKMEAGRKERIEEWKRRAQKLQSKMETPREDSQTKN